MAGRTISDAEERALDTCNDQLVGKFHGTLGTVSASEAVFQTAADQIGIAWEAKSKVGRGNVVCFTDGGGQIVTGWNIDGLQVRP